ncbi:hypothetical protein ABIE78_003384 [Sinorhizobium fredii]
MLYEPDYTPVPIDYYDDPYPAYWYPGAAFFAGAVTTGAVFGAIVDWGVWGGGWGGDIDVDCNQCFNNVDFDGKVNWNDVDWKNVVRSKISLDRDQLNKLDRTNLKNNIKADGNNNLRNRAAEVKRDRPQARPGGGGAGQVRDVRKSTLEGLKAQPRREAAARPAARPSGGQAVAKARADGGTPSVNRAKCKKAVAGQPAVRLGRMRGRAQREDRLTAWWRRVPIVRRRRIGSAARRRFPRGFLPRGGPWRSRRRVGARESGRSVRTPRRLLR